MGRLSLAKWWGVPPWALTGVPPTARDLEALAEFRDRVIEAEQEALEKAKYGLRVDENASRFKGRRGPRKGDTIVTGAKDDGW